MTLTTSYFSRDAADFAAEIQYQLTLNEFVGLKLSLAPYRDSRSTKRSPEIVSTGHVSRADARISEALAAHGFCLRLTSLPISSVAS